MKFTPICLALALLSPVAALRGNRRVQDGDLPVESDFVEVGEATDSPADEEESGTFFSSSSFNGVFDYDVPLAPPPPTPAPTWSASDLAAMAEDGTLIDTDLVYGDAEHHKGGGGGSSKSGSKSRKYSTGTVPGACGTFCQDYVDTCESAHAFFDGGPRGGDPGSRRLIEGDEPTLVRLGESTFEAVDDCLKACAGYPRPYNPDTFQDVSGRPANEGGIHTNSIGDTFWCRNTHLELAKNKGDPFAAQVHCPSASPSGGGVCVNQGIGWDYSGEDLTVTLQDSPLNNLNATVWELIRAGADTGRHLGYCQLYYNDIVADCTNAGIDDDTLKVALGLIPLTVEVLIFSNNVGKPINGVPTPVTEGITTISDNAFENIINNDGIRALIIDHGNLKTLSALSFAGLPSLELLSLNMQPIAAIPDNMLDGLPKLREFTVYNTPAVAGELTSLPDALIFNNPLLERFVVSGHPFLRGIISSFFKNNNDDLSNMKSIDMSNNGITAAGFVPGTLNNMGQLEYLDLSRNNFQVAEFNTITESMRNLRRFSFYDNNIRDFALNFFVFAESLEVALLHDTEQIAPAVGMFSNNPNLISYTISEKNPLNN